MSLKEARAQASTVTSPRILAWQARMQPSALSCSVSESCTAMLTLPDISLTRHDPQVPQRQALSMKTPAWSAASRMVASIVTGALASDA